MLPPFIESTLPLINGLFWPLIGLLVWHAVLCVRLSRRARRGIAIPPHLWSGLPMVIGLVGWLLCLQGFLISYEHYMPARPFTKEHLLMRQLKDVLDPAIFTCLLGSAGLLWSAVCAAAARDRRSAGRCLSLSVGGLLVLVCLSILSDFALLFHSIDAPLASPQLQSLPGPLAGLMILVAGLTLLTRPTAGPRWWRGLGVGIWAPVAANLSAMICCMAIWHTNLQFGTEFQSLHSLGLHLDDLPTRDQRDDFPWAPSQTVVILADETLRGSWRESIFAAPADMPIHELPWPEWLPHDPQTAELEMLLAEQAGLKLEEPDLSLQVVVCPPTSPPLMPGWLEALYPTRPMHCTAMYLPAELRESSGDLTVQQAIDARYGL